MIKGLYFKLNDESNKDKMIFDFFEVEKKLGHNKIDVLFSLIAEHYGKEKELLGLMQEDLKIND